MKTIILLLFAVIIFSCKNESTQHSNESAEISDSERTKLLQEKKQRLEHNQNDSGALDISDIKWGSVHFTPFIPPYPELGSEGIALLESKINTLVSKHGISGTVGNPAFVIIPAINIISKNITSTAPSMYANKYEVTFYTANISTGSIFSSAAFSVKGVGASPLKAFINGLEAINLNDQHFTKMIADGTEKAIKYYEINCSNILQDAKAEAAQKNFDRAVLILKTIPKQVDCYKGIESLIEKYFGMYNAENCSKLLAKMQAELGKQSEIGGFSEAAMSYYALIPSDAPCYKEAQATYNGYLKKLDPNAKQNWTDKEREFNLRKEKQEQDHAFAITKAELEAKVAIAGQTELLDKYKKDYEFNKLPWLRKLVHLGEWDPFDATSKINK